MGDSTLNSLKRGAEELGIDLIDVRTENDERELIEYCELPNTLATRGTLRRKIRELQQKQQANDSEDMKRTIEHIKQVVDFQSLAPGGTYTLPQQAANNEVFVVGALVRGAKQSNGARGNVFKFLQRANGHYSKQEGIQIFYEQDDLSVKAYFMSYDSACGFQNAVYEWETHKELVNLHGITLDPPSPVGIERPIDLVRIYLQDYNPQDSESPCHSIDQLHSFRISIPLTTAVDATSAIGKYQCLDKPLVGYNPYKCHLKDKAKFKSLQKNENNIVAASWELHQQMDGLNSNDGIPGVALSVVKLGNGRIAEHDNRIMVRLNLEFRNTYLAGRFQGNGMPFRVDDTNWQITVYVKDSDTFCDCVRWKHAHTKKQWEDHERFLNNV